VAIVTIDYYLNTYYGEPIAAEEFPRYEARAEQLVNAVTRGRYTALLAQLTSAGHTAAAEGLTTAYSNAICAQIEYYVANGLLAVTTGQSGESFTVGKVSVSSAGSGSSFAQRGAAMLSPAAQMYLEQTGLMGRSVAVPVEPFAPFPLEVW
jgi:hypothetical protein